MKVTATINIDIDLQKVPHDVAMRGMESMERKKFTCTKALLTTYNQTYSEMTCHRLFACLHASMTPYSHCTILNTATLQGRSAFLKHIKSLTDQAHYYSTRNDTQSSDVWFVKLLPSTDAVKELIKLPVTSFNMSIQYWLRHHKGDVDGNGPFGAQ